MIDLDGGLVWLGLRNQIGVFQGVFLVQSASFNMESDIIDMSMVDPFVPNPERTWRSVFIAILMGKEPPEKMIEAVRYERGLLTFELEGEVIMRRPELLDRCYFEAIEVQVDGQPVARAQLRSFNAYESFAQIIRGDIQANLFPLNAEKPIGRTS